MAKPVLLLATGGTIASEPGDWGLAPSLRASDLLKFLPAPAETGSVVARDLLNLDSVNLQPYHWKSLAWAIHESRERYRGVVITHGTDTLGYTGAALSLMLGALELPVVLTGSLLPLHVAGSDGPRNLRDALAVAFSGRPGVFAVFRGEIFRASRVSKVDNSSWQPFASINAPPEGRLRDTKVEFGPMPAIPGREAGCFTSMDNRIIVLRLFPGLEASALEALAAQGHRGLVLEAFGTGGVPFQGTGNLLPGIEAWLDRGLPVVLGSQCIRGQVDLETYEVGQRAANLGVISGLDMSREALVVKLMWVLGQSSNLETIASNMGFNFCGEISEN